MSVCLSARNRAHATDKATDGCPYGCCGNFTTRVRGAGKRRMRRWVKRAERQRWKREVR